MKKFKVIVIAIVLLLVLIVILQNTETVQTKFLFLSFELPRAFLLFLAFLSGFIAGLLAVIRFDGKSKKKREVVSGKENNHKR